MQKHNGTNTRYARHLLLVYLWILQRHPRHLFQQVLGHLCVYSWLVSHATQVSFGHSWSSHSKMTPLLSGTTLRKCSMHASWVPGKYNTQIRSNASGAMNMILDELRLAMQGSKLRPFWSHMLPKCNLCDSKIYLGAFVRVQIIAVVRPLQFSAKRSRITAQHVPRDRELKQVKLFIRALV